MVAPKTDAFCGACPKAGCPNADGCEGCPKAEAVVDVCPKTEPPDEDADEVVARMPDDWEFCIAVLKAS